MGVPQKRERVFFIAKRKDLQLPELKLNFNEKAIVFKEISDENDKKISLTGKCIEYWNDAKEGTPVGKFATHKKMINNDICGTVIASSDGNYHPKYPRQLNKNELCLTGSYPLDYNFGTLQPKYLIGMSVPPVMCAQIAHQIYLQYFKK